MDIMKPLIFICCSFLCLNLVASQIDKTEGWNSDKFKEEAAQTFNVVFHKYNHRVRPPQPYIDIVVSVTLRHIRHLDLHKQELQTVMDVQMNWNDTRLQWYPVKVHQISANISTIWSPDIVYTNSVAETKVLYPTSVTISDRGYVTWTKKEVVTTLCPTQPDTTTQYCPIMLGFLSNSRIDQIDRFFSNLSSFSLAENFRNHEWDIVASDLEFDISNVTSRASLIELALLLERKQDLDTSSNTGQGEQKEIGEITSKSCSRAEEFNQDTNVSNTVEFSIALLALVMLESCILRPFILYR